jgi:integrase
VSKTTVPRRVRVEPGVYRRPDGQLEIGWRDAEGKQRWRKVDGRLKAARTALAEEHARRGRGENVAADPRLRFDGAADAWWIARALTLAENTQNAYGAALRHLRREFGRRRMTTITVTDIAAYIAKKRAAGLKGWTIRGHLTVVSAVFRYSIRHLGVRAQNPVALLDQIERPSTDDEKPKRILSADDLAALIASVEDEYVELFELAAETGMRLSEVLAVQWHEFELDPELASIDIRFQLSRARRGRPARRVKLKTRRSKRVLEITPNLARRLLARKLVGAHSAPNDYVFSTRDGVPLDHRNIGGPSLGPSRRRDSAPSSMAAAPSPCRRRPSTRCAIRTPVA